jgi:hypothetical protein
MVGWLGPKAVLDAVVKRKIQSPHRKSNRRTPNFQLVASAEVKNVWSYTFTPPYMVLNEAYVQIYLYLNKPKYIVLGREDFVQSCSRTLLNVSLEHFTINLSRFLRCKNQLARYTNTILIL